MILYNDNDPKACAWLQELIDAGHLQPGEVSSDPIESIDTGSIPDTFHTFAGIGGWPYALRLAGWPDDKPVWTGSCPCQPFSSAGKRRGTDDERHLWPAFRDLIAERRPATVFGEQVASKAGREWLAGVRADLEALGYAVGAADLCAAGVGAPHIRQRLFWVATSSEWLGNADKPGPQGRGIGCHGSDQWSSRSAGLVVCMEPRRNKPVVTKYRRAPLEPSLFPLADGVPGRVGILRGAGNAIVPQVAAAFVKAYMEVVDDTHRATDLRGVWTDGTVREHQEDGSLF